MTNISNVEVIAKNLIEKESITPKDGGCQEYIKNELADYKFKHENIDVENVKNIWLRKGSCEPLLFLQVIQMLFRLEILMSGIQIHSRPKSKVMSYTVEEHLT